MFRIVNRCNTNPFSNNLRVCSFHRIADLNLNDGSNREISVKGWVTAVRKMKECIFFDVNDGSCFKGVQVVTNKRDELKNLQFGCSIEANGNLIKNKNKQLELQADTIKIIGPCNLEEGYPFVPRKHYSKEYYRQFLHLRPRVGKYSSVLRIRNAASYSFHNFFNSRGFVNINTPIITSNDCEGAGEVFAVEKMLEHTDGNSQELFFGNKTFLTVSGQLHLEVAARCLNHVYSFGPTFRAENSKSRLHLAEFYMLEAETCFANETKDLTSQVEDVIHYVTSDLLNNFNEEIFSTRKLLGEQDSEMQSNIESMATKSFNVMTYDDVCKILLKCGNKLKTKFKQNESLTKEQELFLVKYNGNEPLFIVEWPSKIKPFYMKTSNENSEKVMAFDLLCPNVGEICGGSLREDNYVCLKNVLEKHNLMEKLEWYLELRKFGNVLTGGFGLGFERYLQVLLNIFNIKDVIPFPRWPHNCKM